MKPAKKLSEYTDGELSLLTWMGAFGNGSDRKNALGSRYAKVQALVERQATTNLYEPGGGIADLDKLKKAVEATYSDAAKELIEEIEKEAKK